MKRVLELSACDIPRLKSFVLEAWRLAGSAALGWAGATDENIEEISSESFLGGLIGNPKLKVFISKTGENVVGFCAIRKIDDKTAELAGIVVRQDEIGKGIGTELFNAARKEAVLWGSTAMLVKTESNNNRALSFYRGRGFAMEKEVVEDVSGAKVNLAVLKLNLGKP